jgi:hypothetical protein
LPEWSSGTVSEAHLMPWSFGWQALTLPSLAGGPEAGAGVLEVADAEDCE